MQPEPRGAVRTSSGSRLDRRDPHAAPRCEDVHVLGLHAEQMAARRNFPLTRVDASSTMRCLSSSISSRNCGFQNAKAPGYEADDFLASAAHTPRKNAAGLCLSQAATATHSNLPQIAPPSSIPSARVKWPVALADAGIQPLPGPYQRTINPPTSSLRSQFSELPRSTFWVPGRSNQRSKSTHHSIQAAQGRVCYGQLRAHFKHFLRWLFASSSRDGARPRSFAVCQRSPLTLSDAM